MTEVALAIMWVCGIPTLICRGVYPFFDILLAGYPIAYCYTDYIDSAVHLHIFPISLLIA